MTMAEVEAPVKWWLTQLDADEEAAIEATGVVDYGGDRPALMACSKTRWGLFNREVVAISPEHPLGDPEIQPVVRVRDDQLGRHIALHDPAAVLLQVGADRKLTTVHYPSDRLEYRAPLCAGCCHLYPCDTLLIRVEAYAGREGYQEEWRA